MKRYLIAGVAALGFSANAAAQDLSEDVIVVLGNSQDATAALIQGLGDTGVTLVETTSAVQTSAALGDALVDAGGAAVAGAPNLGLLGSLGFGIINNSIQTPLQGILIVVDDPSAENIGNIFNPEDLMTIGANLPNTTGPLGDGLADAAIGALEGNVTDVGFGLLNGSLNGGVELFADTNYDLNGGAVPILLPIGAVALVGVLGGGIALNPINEQLEPLAAAWAPYVEESQLGLPPLVEVLEDLDLSDPLGQLALVE